MLDRLIELREYHLIAIAILSGMAGGGVAALLCSRLISAQIMEQARSLVEEPYQLGGEFRLQMGRYRGWAMKDVNSEYLEFLITAMPNSEVARNAEICLNLRNCQI